MVWVDSMRVKQEAFQPWEKEVHSDGESTWIKGPKCLREKGTIPLDPMATIHVKIRALHVSRKKTLLMKTD